MHGHLKLAPVIFNLHNERRLWESGIMKFKLQPANGYCYWASELCSQLAQWASEFFLRNLNYRKTVKSILLIKTFFGPG